MRTPKNAELTKFVSDQLNSGAGYHETVKALKEELLAQAMMRNRFNQTQTSKTLRLNRGTLREMLGYFGI